jgi:hypothetical protein
VPWAVDIAAATRGMTVKARAALPHVSGDFVMFLIHVLLIMFVTVNATENRIIVRISVAVRTLIPFAFMTSGVDGEVLSVMIES